MRNFRFSYLVKLTLAVVVGQSVPMAYCAPSEVSLKIVEDYALQLQKVLKKYVQILDRDMVVFHYQRPAPNGWIPKSLADVQNHLMHSPANFYYLAVNEASMEGPGLYGAVDPIASRTFGGHIDPQLYVITVRKGAVLLNLKEAEDSSFRTVVNKINSELNCDTKTETGAVTSGSVTARFRNSDKSICREIIVEAYGKLGIQGILYDYGAAQELHGCRDNRMEAINIISPTIINEKSLAWYSHKGMVEGVPMAGAIQRLYWESVSNAQPELVDDYELKNNIPAQFRKFTIAEEQYEIWKRSHIYKCGPSWSMEKTKSEDGLFGTKVVSTYRDKEVGRLVKLVEGAYRRKNKNYKFPQFSVFNMNQFEVISYMQSGFPKNMAKFDDWKKGKDLMLIDLDGQDSHMKKAVQMAIAKLLGESPRDLSKTTYFKLGQRIPKSILISRAVHPGLLWVLFSPYVGGPKITKMVVNYLILHARGVPFMSEKFTQTLVEGDVEVRRSDRAQYMQLLRTCLNTYADPDETAESIHQGPCGIRETPSKASLLLEFSPYSP